MANKKDTRFLKHLENSIPKTANNYMLSTYSIMLEAWRRGLELDITFNKLDTNSIVPSYTISSNKKSHRFSITRGDLVSVKTKELTKNKETTKDYLLKNDVPTPTGKAFDQSLTDEEIIQYASDHGYPVVIKPLEGTGGRGVIANIQNEEELVEALHYVRVTLKSPHIILEKFFKGDDYRLYVVDGQVVGAIKRVKAHVIGDGKNTVRQLITKKNKIRSSLPSMTNRPIKVDEESKTLLKRKGLNLNSVVPDGEVVILKSKDNVSSGGDSVDITDQVSDNIKRIAVASTECFPDLPQCGVDMIVDEQNDTGVIIELNTRAHITQHLFPMKGQARDIPSHIIDYYFPETISYNRKEASKIYLNFDFIYDAFLSRNASNIKIPKIFTSPIMLKRYILTNCEYTETFTKRIRRLAYNNRVHGYIKPQRNSDIIIVIGGKEKQIEKFYKQMKQLTQKVFKEGEVSIKNRTTPIAHGFKIMEPENPQKTDNNSSDVYLEKYSNLKNDYQKLVRKLSEYEQKESVMELTKRQNEQLKKKIKHFEGSTSWKVTKPLRTLGKFKK